MLNVKRIILGSFLLLVVVGLYSWWSRNPARITADEELVAPQPIQLYDTEGNQINSFNQWIKDTMAASGAPGYNPSQVAQWSGTWGMATKNNLLFMAISLERPTNIAGAILAKATVNNNDPTNLTIDSIPVSNRLNGNGEPNGYLEEDGLQAMEWLNDDRLLIGGTDPAYTDHWDGGNLYTYDISTDTLTKIRCKTGAQQGNCGSPDNIVLPGGIHVLDIAVYGDTVYLSGSTPDAVNSDPILYKSTDAGQTWTIPAVYAGAWYRGIAILPYQEMIDGEQVDSLAWFFNDGSGIWYRNALFYSNNQSGEAGVDWEKITTNPQWQADGDSAHPVIRPILFKGMPLYVEGYYNYNSLFQLRRDEAGEHELREIPLGRLKMGQIVNERYNYRNVGMVATDDYVYIIADDNSLYRSNLEEPVTWQKISEFGETEDMVITIEYWAEQNAIVAATSGVNAQHYLVDLTSLDQPPEAPERDLDNSGNASSFTTASAPNCKDTPPEAIPDIVDIQREGKTAVISFVSSYNATGYYISYGLDKEVHQFGTNFEWPDPPGLVKHTIDDLDPAKTYSFTIRSQNGCKPGEWGPVITVKP